MKSKIVFMMGVCLVLTGTILKAEVPAMDKKFLATLPPAEQALGATVDHWGLMFSCQLARFLAACEQFDKENRDKAPKNFIVGIQHGLEKIPRNKYWFKGSYTTKAYVAAAKNEYENFQVAVLPKIGKEIKSASLTAKKLKQVGGQAVIPEDHITVYRVGWVNTLPARYPSLYTGAWPDPLLPNKPISIQGADLGLFWVEVKVPKDIPAGKYQGDLVLEADGEKIPISLEVKVHAFSLPDRVPFPFAVWVSLKDHQGKAIDAEGFRLICAELLKHGIDPLGPGYLFFSLKKNDFKMLDKNLQFCLDRGLQVIEIPTERNKPERLQGYVEHLKQKGWNKKVTAMMESYDEPDAKTFREKAIPLAEKMRVLYPEVRLFCPSEYHPGIDQVCDIWLTDLSTGKGLEFAGAHAGKADVWAYFCHAPLRVDFYRPLVQGPNMLIDNEAIEHRLAYWIAWKYNLKGMFMWAGNSEWHAKSVDRKNWEETEWKLGKNEYGGFPFGGVFNGNGYLLYPGPHPSIRLKVLRDGLEDYGYFMVLAETMKKAVSKKKKEVARKALAVPAEVLMNPHYFNRDPSALLSARSKIAQLIETLE